MKYYFVALVRYKSHSTSVSFIRYCGTEVTFDEIKSAEAECLTSERLVVDGEHPCNVQITFFHKLGEEPTEGPSIDDCLEDVYEEYDE